MAADDNDVVGQTHGSDDPESVLVGYLLGVGALRAGKEIENGGRFFACPVCVKSRQLEQAAWVKGPKSKAHPSLYEFTQGGALRFNY